MKLGVDFRSLLAQHPGHGSLRLGQPAGEARLSEDGLERAGSGGAPRVGGTPGTSKGDGESAAAELDPLARSLAAPGGFELTPVAHVAGAALSAGGRGVSELAAIEEVVQRVSWGGDRRRGVARIELGGEHAGVAIIVRGEGRDVSLRIELGARGDAGTLPERLLKRLKARGLTVSDVELG